MQRDPAPAALIRLPLQACDEHARKQSLVTPLLRQIASAPRGDDLDGRFTGQLLDQRGIRNPPGGIDGITRVAGIHGEQNMLCHLPGSNLLQRGHGDGSGEQILRVRIHREEVTLLQTAAPFFRRPVSGEEDQDAVFAFG